MNKSPLAEHAMETNHNKITIRLLKKVTKNDELNIREFIGMAKKTEINY